MDTENPIKEEQFIIKGKFIDIISAKDPASKLIELVNHKKSFLWIFITSKGKTVYRHEMPKIQLDDFPITIVSTYKQY